MTTGYALCRLAPVFAVMALLCGCARMGAAVAPSRCEPSVADYLPARTALVVSARDLPRLADELGYERIVSELDRSQRSEMLRLVRWPLESVLIPLHHLTAVLSVPPGQLGLDVHGPVGVALLDARALRWAFFARVTAEERLVAALAEIAQNLGGQLDTDVRGGSRLVWPRGSSEVAVLLRDGWAFLVLAPDAGADDALAAAVELAQLERSRSLGASGLYRDAVARLHAGSELTGYLAVPPLWYMAWERLIPPEVLGDPEGIEAVQRRIELLELMLQEADADAGRDEEDRDEDDEDGEDGDGSDRLVNELYYYRERLSELREALDDVRARRVAVGRLASYLAGARRAAVAFGVDVERRWLGLQVHVHVAPQAGVRRFFGATDSAPIVRDALRSRPLALVEGRLDAGALMHVARVFDRPAQERGFGIMEHWPELLSLEPLTESLAMTFAPYMTGRGGLAITDDGVLQAKNLDGLFRAFGFHAVLELEESAHARALLGHLATRHRLEKPWQVVISSPSWKPLHVTVAGRYVVASTSRQVLARLVRARLYERRGAGEPRSPSLRGIVQGGTHLRRLVHEYGQPSYGVIHIGKKRRDVPPSDEYRALEQAIAALERHLADAGARMWKDRLRAQAELDQRMGPIHWAITHEPWGLDLAAHQHLGDDSVGAIIVWLMAAATSWNERSSELDRDYERLREMKLDLEDIQRRDIERHDRDTAPP